MAPLPLIIEHRLVDTEIVSVRSGNPAANLLVSENRCPRTIWIMPQRRDPTSAQSQEIILFHAARSNCSARVRLLLAEKSLPWTSRMINLQLQENRTPDYFAVNPKGLVPAIIHDGWVVTESNDVLAYLEHTFPAPRFTPLAADAKAAMADWLSLSETLHLPGVKTLNYSRRSRVSMPDVRSISYRALQKDPDLLEFHEKAARGGFTVSEQHAATALLDDALRRMDQVLARQPWLAGGEYSLADIAWVTTMPTLTRCGFDFTPCAHVIEWHQRISIRPAYLAAVTAWEVR